MRTRTLVTGLVVFACVAAVTANAAPAPFTLVFHGSFVPNRDIGSTFGVASVGPFSASAPFCPSGQAIDTAHVRTATVYFALRRFTCDDGSGTVTARIQDFRAEIGANLERTWKILSGTGDYARLRGQGTFEGVQTGGGDSPETKTFIATWRGVADFDDIAPAVQITRATATKLGRPNGAYLVRLAFSVRDDVETNAVSYEAKVRAGAFETVPRKGDTRSGTVSLSLRLRPPRGMRTVRIVITASDPVGNERTVTRSLRLR
jgi:hypothetical protein